MFLSKASVLFVAYVCFVSLSTSKANEVEGLEGLDAGNGAAPCPWTGPRCIDDCRGRPNGFYQWCLSCNTVAYCSSERIYFLSCPPGTVWDDNRKQCNQTSTTCYCYEERETCKNTGPRCITSCTGLKDGDYQSCHGCSVYVSCVGGYLLYDYRPCAPAWPRPPLRWDDYAKKCLYTSRTCTCSRQNELEENELPWSQILKK
jgi:hypothetical protein